MSAIEIDDEAIRLTVYRDLAADARPIRSNSPRVWVWPGLSGPFWGR